MSNIRRLDPIGTAELALIVANTAVVVVIFFIIRGIEDMSRMTTTLVYIALVVILAIPLGYYKIKQHSGKSRANLEKKITELYRGFAGSGDSENERQNKYVEVFRGLLGLIIAYFGIRALLGFIFSLVAAWVGLATVFLMFMQVQRLDEQNATLAQERDLIEQQNASLALQSTLLSDEIDSLRLEQIINRVNQTNAFKKRIEESVHKSSAEDGNRTYYSPSISFAGQISNLAEDEPQILYDTVYPLLFEDADPVVYSALYTLMTLEDEHDLLSRDVFDEYFISYQQPLHFKNLLISEDYTGNRHDVLFLLSLIEDCVFSSSSYEKTSFNLVRFNSCVFYGADFDECSLAETEFKNCDFKSFAYFQGCEFYKALIYDCTMDELNFQHTDLTNTTICASRNSRECKLNFDSECTLDGVWFVQVRFDCTTTDLHDVDLSNVTFAGCKVVTTPKQFEQGIPRDWQLTEADRRDFVETELTMEDLVALGAEWQEHAPPTVNSVNEFAGGEDKLVQKIAKRYIVDLPPLD